MRDSRLIRQILEGDREAGERFVTEQYPRIYRFLRHLTGSNENAEDLTQQTFMKAWQGLAAFRGEASLATWLHRIAYHEYTHWLRARREHSPLDHAAAVVDEGAAREWEAIQLREALAQLFSPTETAVLAQTFTALRKVRSYHWTGVEVLYGREQRWEVWYSDGRSREQIGDQTIIDNGVHQRRYRAGSKVVIVDHSGLTGSAPMPKLMQPGGFLARIEAMDREPGWRIQVDVHRGLARGGRAVQRFDISISPAGKVPLTDAQQGKITLLVDPSTKLPEGWAAYDRYAGRWQLRQRIDRIDYNLAIPAQVFDLKLPAGTRSVVVDHSNREQAQLATQTTPRGWKIILRAIDRTQEGDVMVSVSDVPPGQDRSQPDPVPLKMLKDDRGTIYADTHNDLIARNSTMF